VQFVAFVKRGFYGKGESYGERVKNAQKQQCAEANVTIVGNRARTGMPCSMRQNILR
jgi:hypothetical protein